MRAAHGVAKRPRSRARCPSYTAAVHGTYVGNGRVLVQSTWGAKLMAASDDLSLMPDLVTTGQYDVPFTAFLRRELSRGMVAFDVGANIGVFTVLMAWQVGPPGFVVAYEPAPRSLQLLRENVAMNYLTPWVEIVPRAASDREGHATLYTTSRFHGTTSLNRHDAAYARHFGGLDVEDQVQIELEPLDRHVGRFEEIALIKVDVEGAELHALRGMRRLLASGTVRRLSVEITRSRGEQDWTDLVAELRALHAAGWRYSTIDEDGTLHPLELDRLIDVGLFSQVVFDRP